MMFKKVLVMLLCGALLLAGCSKAPKDSEKSKESTNKKSFKVAMITSGGGLGDRSYNDSAYEGLQRIESELGMEIKVVEPADVSEGEKYLTELAKAGYDLVATLEYGHADVLNTVAPQFPDTRFVSFNIVVDQPNVTSVIFKEHQGSFLAGALAALVTTDASIDKTNDKKIISAIGGVQSPGIDKFIVGFEEGAQYIDPEIKVLKGYSNSFGDPAKGKELALVQIDQGSDVIYQIAGGTGEGIFEAVKDKNVFAIGVDSDQDYIVPGNILTSMMKRLDMAMVMLAEKLKDGTIKDNNVIELGLDEGTELSPMEHTKDMLKPEYLEQLHDISKKIISGEINVSDVTKE